jgi:hypothetical protein
MTTEPPPGEGGPNPGQTPPPGTPPGRPYAQQNSPYGEQHDPYAQPGQQQPGAQQAYQQQPQPYQPGVQPYQQPYQQQPGYPPQQPGYPPQQPGYPPQQQQATPEQQAYADQQAYQQAYGQQPGGYPPGQPQQPGQQPGHAGQQHGQQPGQGGQQPGQQPYQSAYPQQPGAYAPQQPHQQQPGAYAQPQHQQPHQPQQQGGYGPPQPSVDYPSPQQRSDYGQNRPGYGGGSGFDRPGAGPRSFDGPLPDAPADSPPLQWGTPLSAAAPAPKAPPKPKVSKLAVLALILGALAGVPVLVAALLEKDLGRWAMFGPLAGGCGLALILGLVALMRTRSGKRRGSVLAVIGIVLAAAWGAGAAYVYLQVINKPEARDSAGKVVRKGDVPVTSLKVGECIEKWEVTNTIGTVTILPCTSNHDAEVFHTFTATGSDKFPGDKAVTDEATTQCVAKAKTALKPDDLKKAKIAFLKPVEASWGKKEKQITCVAKMDAPLGRSVRK